MSDPESISSGRTVPQWSKHKPDLNAAAFSPPSHDDSFFYIRYPIVEKAKNEPLSNLKTINEALSDLDKKPTILSKNDFQQHTEPCKLFLENSRNDSTAPLPTFSNIKNQTKPFGTDDGFKGAGAACGNSIVKVARQMVSGKSLNRGFTVASFTKDTEVNSAELIDNESDIDSMTLVKYHNIRRGSKSLPTSPLGSPKSMRKVQPNPYFTGQFSVANTATDSGNRGGWFLSSLLGIQREAISTTSVVSNVSEDADDGLEVSSTTSKNSSTINQKVLRAKPSELREMNFWSPTSM